MKYYDNRREVGGMAATKFGKKITALRKEKGLTQAKLAEQINVSNKTISRWETGEGYPEISLLRPLAKALGTTVDDLLSEDEETETPEDAIAPKGYKETDIKRENIASGEKIKKEEIPIKMFSFRKMLKEIIFSDITWLFLYIAVAAFGLIPDYDINTYKEASYIGKTEGSIIIAIFVLFAIGLLIAQIRKWKTGKRDRNVALGNVFFILVFAIGYLASFQTVFNVYTEDYFKLNRDITMWATGIVVCGLVIINFYSWWKNRKDCDFYQFYQSLIIFNKIAVVTLLISLICSLLSLGFFFRGTNTVFITFYMYPVFITNIGLVCSVIGLILGLLGVYKKQTKGCVVLAIICFIGRYVIPLFAMLPMMVTGWMNL